MITIINNNNYILGDYILINAPIFCKGFRGVREMIKKKNIEKDKYIFARKINNEWITSNGKSTKVDKVFFIESIINSIPELTKNTNEQTITDDTGIEKAPPIIYLSDNEKFKDENGEVFEIETIGIRNEDNIYFKVKDIEKQFDINRLRNIIINEKTIYELNTDYKYFLCENHNNVVISTNKKSNDKTTIKKQLYLTYLGMLRMLFVSRNNKTRYFINWAKNILFAAQLGTIEQKDILISQIKGVSYASIQELFSINAREMPCVYLTAFNKVSVLRESMNIDSKFMDDDIVYKFGLTKSFEQRKNGHKTEYKNLASLIEMKLVYYTYIDPLYISEAENEIKNLLDEYKIKYDTHDELVIIPNNLLKFVKTAYQNLGSKYSGHTHEFIKKIDELERYITSLKKDNEHNINIYEMKISSKDLIIDNKDLIIENLKKELYIKELELKLNK
jgi:hypothetical protein